MVRLMPRTWPTLDTETTLLSDGASCLLAYDEVGRGAGCGPVVIGLVVLHPPVTAHPAGLADSKTLSPRQRDALVGPVRSWVAGHALGEASAAEVDALGILAALRLAVQRGYEQILTAGHAPDVALVDGDIDFLEGVLPASCQTVTQPKADRDCASVAAASVLAKEHRDALMREMHVRYPGYGLDRNAGYPTPAHKQAVRDQGLSPEHRRSWTW